MREIAAVAQITWNTERNNWRFSGGVHGQFHKTGSSFIGKGQVGTN